MIIIVIVLVSCSTPTKLAFFVHFSLMFDNGDVSRLLDDCAPRSEWPLQQQASKPEAAEEAASATTAVAAASSVATKRGVRGSLTVPYSFSADGMPLDRLRSSTGCPTNFGTAYY